MTPALDKLRILVDMWVQEGQMLANTYDGIGDSIEDTFGVRPENLKWGATCLYIDFPAGVRLGIDYKT
jgi:hypothetical protein